MNKEEYIKLAESKWPELEALQQEEDFYAYEKRFAQIMEDLNLALLQAHLGEAPQDYRKKKSLQTTFGPVGLSKDHPFCKWPGGFKASPLLAERIVYVGQLQVYEQGSELLERLAGVSVSDSTIYRMANHYGQAIEEELYQERPQEEEAAAGESEPEEEVVYAQFDGSMLFTDQGWQEVKVGRVFIAADCQQLAQQGQRGQIKCSQYAALLGNCRDFTPRLDSLIRPQLEAGRRLVLITDGAQWMRKWMDEHYPKAEQILDFFHVCGHLSEFAKAVAGQGVEDPDRWYECQRQALLEGQLPQLIARIERLPLARADSLSRRDKLLSYLRENSYRMDYKRYQDQGLMIGSGAIEAAHRTLVQQRMKRSGQRWSEDGANNLLNLRVCMMSGQWPMLIRHIRPKNKDLAKT